MYNKFSYIICLLFALLFNSCSKDESSNETFKLTVSVLPEMSGSVTPINESYAPGSVVTLTAIPTSGYEFSEWQIGVSSSANPVDIIMDSDKTVIAMFQEIRVNIPDSNFEQALLDLGIDSDGIINGFVLTSDISDILTLPVNEKNIRDLSGIEYFTNLRKLDCANNELEYLDVSNNKLLKELNCRFNKLKGLVLSKNVDLTSLSCSGNQITTLDLRQNVNLVTLACSGNLIDQLDLSKNSALLQLYCNENKLNTLDLSGNKDLRELYVADNSLTGLDVSRNTALNLLYCSYNEISTLDVSNNTKLTLLVCLSNQISALDVSQNSDLDLLVCNDNFINSLDLSNNKLLSTLVCSDNQLENLDVKNGNNPGLVNFDSTKNDLLTCIEVDNANLANANQEVYSAWSKDAIAVYSENCQ